MCRIATRNVTNEKAYRCSGQRRGSHEALVTSVDQLPILLSVPLMASTGAASSSQLRKMLQAGELRGVKVGSDWRVSKDVFCEYFGLA